MSRIKSRDTSPELHLRALAHRDGCRIRLHVKQLLGSPDVVPPRRLSKCLLALDPARFPVEEVLRQYLVSCETKLRWRSQAGLF